MRQRTQKQIEEMNKLFREIGASEGEVSVPISLSEAKLLCKGKREHEEFPFSETCQKVIYPSESTGSKIAAIRRKKGSGPLRTYRCDLCHGFHLTGYIPAK